MSKVKDYLKESKNNMTTMGEFIKRYRYIYLAILLLVAVFEVGMMIYMSIRLSQKYSIYAVIYMCCYVVLFVSSAITAIVVLLSKKKNIKPFVLSVVMHVYVIIIMLWATTISSVDMLKGNYPIVYLTILITIGSIVFIDPILYSILGALSMSAIFVVNSMAQSDNSMGFYFNIVVFIIMSVVVAYRNFKVSLAEEKNKKHFQILSEYDALTGLKNENSYYKLVDSLVEKIKNGENVNFTISMMDVNLLKATNDKYGHQYGAHLIKTAGQNIGKIFEKSHAFHVGGDEFIVVSIIDHNKVEEYVQKFDEKMRYAPMTYKGNEIVLSVARGYASYKKGDQYFDVFERADKAMYENKKQMKKELNLTDR